jgi:Carboxypeptidase regulatory-like domain/Putative zinc-finger
MSELLQSGQHPDADQLSAFIEHALPAHEREETLAHLAICPHCRSIVALSLPPAEELPEAHAEPVRRPWLSRRIMVWPAGAALAALILAGIYIRNGFVVEKHVTPMETAQSTPPAADNRLQPTPTLKLQAPGKVAARSGPVLAAHAPETAPSMEALDRLMPIPNGGISTRHLNQKPMTAFGAAKVEDRAALGAVVGGQPTLPSGLRALSTVANAGEVVAIDTQHTLFFSNDHRAHWSVISQPWQGRAVKVELVPVSYPASTRNRPVVAAGLGVGTGLRDAVEGPKATLSGEITDPAGASIPNASVVVTNSLTQVVRRTTTNPAGHYTVDQLDPGNYTLQAEAPGFTPQQMSGLSLNGAQQSQRDFTLAVGAAAQTVEVQGEAQVALTAPKVKEKIAATRALAPPVSRFEITTDAGEHWISTDGRSWQRKNE